MAFFPGVFGDVPHFKTGATALHVAAAKGYIKVINLLIQAGAQVNIQVYTKLHVFNCVNAPYIVFVIPFLNIETVLRI